MPKLYEKPNIDQVAWSVRNWRADVGGFSEAHTYKLIREGKIRTTKIGGKRLILTSPRDFIEAEGA